MGDSSAHLKQSQDGLNSQAGKYHVVSLAAPTVPLALAHVSAVVAVSAAAAAAGGGGSGVGRAADHLAGEHDTCVGDRQRSHFPQHVVLTPLQLMLLKCLVLDAASRHGRTRAPLVLSPATQRPMVWNLEVCAVAGPLVVM